MNYNLEKNTGWVTYLASDSHLYFVLHLHKCLQDVKTKYPFFVILNNGISEEVQLLLQEVGIKIIQISEAPLLLNTLSNEPNYWVNGINQLYCFSLGNFNKIVYIDPSIEVYKNIDFLFDKPHLSAISTKNALNKYVLGQNYFNTELLVWDFNIEFLALWTLEYKIETLLKNDQLTDNQTVLNFAYKNWVKNEQLKLDFLLDQSYCEIFNGNFKQNIFDNQIEVTEAEKAFLARIAKTIKLLNTKLQINLPKVLLNNYLLINNPKQVQLASVVAANIEIKAENQKTNKKAKNNKNKPSDLPNKKAPQFLYF